MTTVVLYFVLAALALGSVQRSFADDYTPPPCPTCPDQGYDFSGMIGNNTPLIHNSDGSEAPPTSTYGSNDTRILEKKNALMEIYENWLSGNAEQAGTTSLEDQLAAALEDLREDPSRHQLGNHAGCTDGTITCLDASDGSITSSVSTPTNMPNMPIQNVIWELQQSPQITSYYCGPGTAWSVLRGLGDYYSYYSEPLLPESTGQHTLAATCTAGSSGCVDTRGKYLQTDSWQETPWLTTPGTYPMAIGLNKWRSGTASGFYLASTVSNDATGLAAFKRNLTGDINLAYPLAANIVELAGGTHLPGHPNVYIGHWVALRGYNNYGDNTRYADPAYSSYVSWGHNAGMAAYNSVHTQYVMLPLVSRRGYVW